MRDVGELRAIVVVYHPLGVYVERENGSRRIPAGFCKPFMEQSLLQHESVVAIFPHWQPRLSADMTPERSEWHELVICDIVIEAVRRQGCGDLPVFWAGVGEGAVMAQVMANRFGGDGVYVLTGHPLYLYDGARYPLYYMQLSYDSPEMKCIRRDTLEVVDRYVGEGVPVNLRWINEQPPFWSLDNNRDALEFLLGSCGEPVCLGEMRDRQRREWGLT